MFRAPYIKENKRTIYGVLDFLGDVGGLSDALLTIGSALVALIELVIGNSLTKFLLSNIFEQDNSHKITTKSNKSRLLLISKRKPFKIKAWSKSQKQSI